MHHTHVSSIVTQLAQGLKVKGTSETANSMHLQRQTFAAVASRKALAERLLVNNAPMNPSMPPRTQRNNAEDHETWLSDLHKKDETAHLQVTQHEVDGN